MKRAVFDLTVEGRTAKDLPFANDKVHRIQSIAVCPNTKNCTLYLDFIRVSVSPPK